MVVNNNQTPSLRQDSLLRENLNIFMNVTYQNVSYLHIQGIQYDSITLYKGKFHIKYLFGTRLDYS